MNKLIEWYKRIKTIRLIISIFFIIMTVLPVFLFFSRLTVHAEARDPSEAGVFDELKEGSTVASGDVQALMQWCETIAKHYAANGYSWSGNGGYSLEYEQQTMNKSCCTIYAQQALHKAGMLNGIDESNWWRIWVSGKFGKWLDSNPDWRKLKAGEKEDVGDVHIYALDGHSHTNIYAGDGKYWDAGASRNRSIYWNYKRA